MTTSRNLANISTFVILIVLLLTAPARVVAEGVTNPEALCSWNGASYRCYAHVWRSPGSYSGVHGTISTADPVLRESNATSGAQIAIVSNSGQWIELGWTKQANNHNCDTWLYWATDPGNPHFIRYVPSGVNYRLTIAVTDEVNGYWRVKVVEDSTNNLLDEILINVWPVWNRGYMLQANGEVGPSNTNDMGVSGMINLKLRTTPGSGWYTWFQATGFEDPPYPPYRAVNLGNPYNWQVYGGQGQPGFYCQ
ncbi:MAG: hypothetical protein R2844_02655 [Caldilineales bacterium]